MRCLYLHAPLSFEQFRALEAPVNQRAARLSKGEWRSLQALQPSARALQAFGPRMPTASERFAFPPSEDDPLTCVSRGFTPSPAHVVWITDHIKFRSTEGNVPQHTGFGASDPRLILSLGMYLLDAPRRAATCGRIIRILFCGLL